MPQEDESVFKSSYVTMPDGSQKTLDQLMIDGRPRSTSVSPEDAKVIDNEIRTETTRSGGQQAA